jgi:hypothetical protein
MADTRTEILAVAKAVLWLAAGIAVATWTVVEVKNRAVGDREGGEGGDFDFLLLCGGVFAFFAMRYGIRSLQEIRRRRNAVRRTRKAADLRREKAQLERKVADETLSDDDLEATVKRHAELVSAEQAAKPKGHTATMTISEAQQIVGIMTAALQDTNNYPPRVYRDTYSSEVEYQRACAARQRTLEACFQGYDVHQILTAVNLQIAVEFRYFWMTDAGECIDAARQKKFEEGVNLYGGAVAAVVFNFFDLLEDLPDGDTPSSFRDYCKYIGSKDPLYWQKIYTRLGMPYTRGCPQGNIPLAPFPREDGD